MTRLNHPLKRLSFILFLCSAVVLAGLALSPPAEISTSAEWKDAAASDTADRYVTRINTPCAATHIGTIEEFARDFFIAFSSEDEVSRVITEMGIERHEPSTIAPTVDLTEKEKTALFSTLSSEKKPCLKGVCVAKLDPELFTSILKACGTSVGQVRRDAHEVRWRISSNLEDTFPWSLVALLLSIFFLLSSLLYDRTLGPLIKWIRTGSW